MEVENAGMEWIGSIRRMIYLVPALKNSKWSVLTMGHAESVDTEKTPGWQLSQSYNSPAASFFLPRNSTETYYTFIPSLDGPTSGGDKIFKF